LYGAAVKPDNISDLMKKPDIDGALVGGACLEADSFLASSVSTPDHRRKAGRLANAYLLLITAVHVIVCVILILVVLLQSGKGADLAGAFGGGANSDCFWQPRAGIFSIEADNRCGGFVHDHLSLPVSHGDRRRSVCHGRDPWQAGSCQEGANSRQPATPAPTPDQIKKIQEEIEAKQKQSPADRRSSRLQSPRQRQHRQAACGPEALVYIGCWDVPRFGQQGCLGNPNLLQCRSGGTGRHAILRGCGETRGGSSPPFGTN